MRTVPAEYFHQDTTSNGGKNAARLVLPGKVERIVRLLDWPGILAALFEEPGLAGPFGCCVSVTCGIIPSVLMLSVGSDRCGIAFGTPTIEFHMRDPGGQEGIDFRASLDTSGGKQSRARLIANPPPRFVIGKMFPAITIVGSRGITTAGHNVRRQVGWQNVATGPRLDLSYEVGIELNARLHEIAHVVLDGAYRFTVNGMLAPSMQTA